MPKAGKQWYYAVKRGRIPGVYLTWAEAERQILGYPAALHRKFPDHESAQEWANITADSNTDFAFRGASTASVKDEAPLATVGPEENQAILDWESVKNERNAATKPPSPSAYQLNEIQPAVAAEAEVVLSEQQSRALKTILSGQNYFFTGSAGTGKSVLLRAIIKAFQARQIEAEKAAAGRVRSFHEDDSDSEWKVAITASTGMAAVNIGGCTLHSWAGIGLGALAKENLLGAILRKQVARRRWLDTNALIIDEISMIDGDLLDKIEWIAQKVRSNSKPFGGIQVILCGDFHQLPPVPDRKTNKPVVFAFDAKCWNRLIPNENILTLTRVFRQKEDSFVKILENIRKGRCTNEQVKLLQACNRVVRYEDGVEPVSLWPSKVEVKNINDGRLAALNTPQIEYNALDIPGADSSRYRLSPEKATELLDRNTRWVAQLRLKVGAMVMLVTNLSTGALVNGSTGLVVDFMTPEDAAAKGVMIADKVGPNALGHPPNTVWPVVEFIPSKHATVVQYKRVLIPAMAVDVLNAQGEAEATRHQVPLVLAWAITIHKSQGQTLERVKVDLRRIFEAGQTYVALSRATSLETLEIRNFALRNVIASPRVIKWAEPYESAQKEEDEWDQLMSDPVLSQF